MLREFERSVPESGRGVTRYILLPLKILVLFARQTAIPNPSETKAKLGPTEV